MYLKELKLIPSNVYEIPFKITIENKLRSFQFKLLLYHSYQSMSLENEHKNFPPNVRPVTFLLKLQIISFWRDVLNWWNFKCSET